MVKEFCPKCGVVIKDGLDCMSWCPTREDAVPVQTKAAICFGNYA